MAYPRNRYHNQPPKMNLGPYLYFAMIVIIGLSALLNHSYHQNKEMNKENTLINHQYDEMKVKLNECENNPLNIQFIKVIAYVLILIMSTYVIFRIINQHVYFNQIMANTYLNSTKAKFYITTESLICVIIPNICALILFLY